MKCSMKGFFSKCDQIRKKLRIWSLYWTNKPLMENFIFCAVKQLIEGYNEGLFLLLSCVDLDYNFK